MGNKLSAHRLPWLDAARGGALIAMFFYHLGWDLGFFGLIDPAFPNTPAFKYYGHAIAATFFALAGAAQALAFARPDPWLRFWRRLALLAAAAGAISFATYWIFPEDFIYFGMLHCLALGGLVLAPLLAAPLWLVGLLAAACFALPLLIASPTLDAPAFWWLGLGTHLHRTVDVRPFFPWFAMMLMGMAAVRLNLAPTIAAAPSPLTRGLAWMGRHSLAIYLVHQPIFLGVLAAVVSLAGANPLPPPPGFADQCRASCESAGTTGPICKQSCDCLVDTLKREKLWSRVETGVLNADERSRIGEFALACLRPGP